MRNSRSFRDCKMQLTVNTFTVAHSVSAALRRAYGDLSAPVKRWCQAAGVDPRAGRNHYEGQNCPGAPALIRGMADCDELLFEVLRMAGRLTPETVERLLDVVAELEAASPSAKPERRPPCGH